jgi:hypothetical protein
MILSDIIKQESDRIFVVDHSCFIIFTGNSVEDSQPFIRIGNWHEMPVDLIPLIENIIVTDNLTGNPALEQFNININLQSSNRYIGSHYTLRKYLEFQKIFGLDLKNVSVVDVENDIPEINSRTISDRESFIGIFYRDGNFRITHKGKNLFDLHKVLLKTYNTNKIVDLLYENCRVKGNFSSQGFIINDTSTIFYDDDDFYIHNFPDNYRTLFNNLGINPKKIKIIAQQSANYIALTEFLGWLNSNELKCTLLSDDKSCLSVMKKLFSKAQIATLSLSSSDVPLGQNVTIKELNGSNNQIVSFSSTEKVMCQVLFISTRDNVLKEIKKNIQAVFISSSLYEEFAIVLKASGIPTAVIDDGDKTFKKITSLTETPVFKNVKYKVSYFPSTNECLNYFSSLNDSDELIHALITNDKDIKEKIEEYLNSEIIIFSKLNFLSLIQYFNNITQDRKLSSLLSKIHQEYGQLYNVENLSAMKVPFSSELIIADNGIFQFFFPMEKDSSQKFFIPAIGVTEPDKVKLYSNFSESVISAERIRIDRERLGLLIKLFASQSKKTRIDDISNLKDSISRRKDLYSKSFITKDEVESINENSRSSTSENGTSRQHASGGSDTNGTNKGLFASSTLMELFLNSETYKSLIQKREVLKMAGESVNQNGSSVFKPQLSHYFMLSKPVIFIRSLRLPVLVLLIILLSSLLLFNTLRPVISTVAARLDFNKVLQEDNKTDGTNAELTANGGSSSTESTGDPEPTTKTDLEERVSGDENNIIIERYDISVSDRDIYYYANEIAALNGYHPILLTSVNGKNPHWIYPDNVFTLPDGERFQVRSGDSLWKIAELKLTKISIEFYKITEEIKSLAETGSARPDILFSTAETLSFNDSHKKIIEDLKKLF